MPAIATILKLQVAAPLVPGAKRARNALMLPIVHSRSGASARGFLFTLTNGHHAPPLSVVSRRKRRVNATSSTMMSNGWFVANSVLLRFAKSIAIAKLSLRAKSGRSKPPIVVSAGPARIAVAVGVAADAEAVDAKHQRVRVDVPVDKDAVNVPTRLQNRFKLQIRQNALTIPRQSGRPAEVQSACRHRARRQRHRPRR
jgi:hypothetical protein